MFIDNRLEIIHQLVNYLSFGAIDAGVRYRLVTTSGISAPFKASNSNLQSNQAP